MGWEDIGNWISSNKDWLAPVAKIGVGAYQTMNQNNANSDYASLINNATQEDYNQQKANYDAAVQAQQSNMAAAAANNAAKLAAQRKALEAETAKYNEAMGYLKPFRESAKRILPKQEKTYTDTLGGLSNLMALYQSPEMMAKLNQSVPAYSVKMQLPDYLRG